MFVMKFGGTSVGDRSRLGRVAELVTLETAPVTVVVSAMGGTTDKLLAAGNRAEGGDRSGALEVVEALRDRHFAVADDGEVAEILDALFVELRGLLEGVYRLREQTSRSRALLASFGERLCVPLAAWHIARTGRRSEAIDARELIVTDEAHEEGQVDLVASRERVRARLLPLLDAGVIPVVTGFLGATPGGVTTVLGRGGSDYTAALLGSMLDAEEVWIWTDVDGILTADPRIVPDATTLARVSYREAAEMSYFGAKVVHPKTMVPAMDRGIPIRIRSTFDPDAAGTLISETAPTLAKGVKTVTSIRDQALVTVEGRGLAGLPGIARRIFGAAETASSNVVMISQASSEQSVSLVVSASDAPALVAALEQTFALEVAAGLVDRVRVRRDVAVVSIIGEGMAGTQGISGALFGALGATGVNVVAIAQGASELSISVAIDEADVVRAVRAVHGAFGLRHSLDIVLVGVGRVARSFLQMLEATSAELRARDGLSLRLIAVANSRRALVDGDGIALSELDARLASAPPRPDDDVFLEQVLAARHAEVALVDLTAAHLAPLHQAALERRIHVVTANKIPISGSLASYRQLTDAVHRTGARYGYETTFGAGLPVLHTLKELMSTGDTLHSVSGCFSGTLGFLCTRLEQGLPLAEAVSEAEERGYTEPDPRDDLSGRDVARKALIVARAMGLDLEPSDVSLEPLVPGLEAGLAEAMADYGPKLAARIEAAAARGEVLRYVAEVTPEEVRVGLREVPRGGAIGSLQGPDNILVFRTSRYHDYPLVIRGPGAGADVTAAGVLGDVLRVARG